jgi:hypothetical protein
MATVGIKTLGYQPIVTLGTTHLEMGIECDQQQRESVKMEENGYI